MVQKINSKEELQKAIQDNKILLVKYGASWCGPCKMLTPVLEELSEDAPIVDVDVDELREIAVERGIMSVPVLEFYKNGEMVKQETGFRPEDMLREILNDIKE